MHMRSWVIFFELLGGKSCSWKMTSITNNSIVTETEAEYGENSISSRDDSTVNEPVKIVVTEASSVDIFMDGNCDPQPGTVEEDRLVTV